jgi:hypothetical protein
VALLILTLAAGGAFYYWSYLRAPPQPPITTTQHPVQFEFLLNPPFFHVAAGGGRNITVYLQRSPDFSGTVRFELVNPPDWIVYTPFTVEAKDSNATFTIIASQNAPKTELNLTMRASSAGAAEQYATLEMKLVGVHAVTSEWGSAVVFDTTKVIDSDTLKVLNSYSDGTFVFPKMTPQLQSLARGDVLVVPPSSTSLAKYGLLRLVLSVTQQGGGVVVQTIQATLFDELQEVKIGETGSESAAPQGAPSGLASSGLMLGDAAFHDSSKPQGWFEHGYIFTLYDNDIGLNGPVNLGGDATLNFQGKLTLQLLPGIDIRGAFKLASFKIHLAFAQDLTFSLHGSAGSQLNWNEPSLVQLYGGSFYLIPPILWVSAKASLEGRASGILNQNIELDLKNEFFTEVGPTYDADEGGWHMYYRCNSANEGVCDGPTVDKSFTISPGSGSDAKLGIGPRIEVGVNGDVGVASAAGWAALSGDFFMNLKSQIPSKPSSWVDWGIDAYLGLGLQVTIGRWGISHTFGISYEWPSGTLLGPYRLFDGPNMAPLVDIAYPNDGATFDYGSMVQYPAFKATALDPETGDMCSASKSSLTWESDQDGKIGEGCVLPTVKLEKAGVHRITFTATDSEGKSSGKTVAVTVVPAKPIVYLTKPQDGQTFTMTLGYAIVTLEGYAIVGLPGSVVPCSQMDFAPGYYVGYIASQPESGTQYCTAQAKFDKAGSYVIYAAVRDASGHRIAYSNQAKINVVEPSLGANSPPVVEIISPHDQVHFIYSNDMVPLDGTVYDPEGDPLGAYRWVFSTYSPLLHMWFIPTTIATGPLPSSSSCTLNQPCHVTATLNAGDYCQSYVAVEGRLWLEANQTGPVEQTGSSPALTIYLDCQKSLQSVQPFPGTLLWLSCKDGLSDTTPAFSVRIRRELHSLAPDIASGSP